MKRAVDVLTRLILLAMGTLVAFAMAEGVARWTEVAELADLDASFDRPEPYYRAEPERSHPWTRGLDDFLKVAVVGDSFTVGQSNHWDDAYPARLERLLNLNTSARPAEVRVYGKRGTSTGDQRRYLQHIVDHETDLLILGIFLNDSERPGADDFQELRKSLAPPRLDGWKRTFVTSSHALTWIYQRLAASRSRQAQKQYMRAIWEKDFSGFRRFQGAIGHFSQACLDHDIRLVAVIFPVMAYLSGTEYPHEYAHERIAEVTHRHDIPTLDLLPTFRGLDDRRMAAYHQIDAHPSEIGHRIAADAIFRFLLDESLIDASYQPEKETREGRAYWLKKLRRMRNPLEAAPARS